MSYQAKIKRYLYILQQIDNQQFPAISEMISRINETGINVSDRQLKRDIESLRDEFGLDIRYSAQHRGYFLESRQLTFPYFLKLLELSQNTELIADYLKKGLDVSEILDFEDFNSFKGIGYIPDLAWAIQHRKEIGLCYQRFDADEKKNYLFQPYLLREYMNRWYVIGFLAESGELRTFGLDRIIHSQPTGKSFTKRKENQIAELFQNIVGINASLGDKPEDIQLSCQLYQGSLLKSLPLHASQKLVSETAEEIIFSYRIVVNLELKQRLLMIANQARVISPLTLKVEMEKMIIEAQNLYKNE